MGKPLSAVAKVIYFDTFSWENYWHIDADNERILLRAGRVGARAGDVRDRGDGEWLGLLGISVDICSETQHGSR